MKLLYITNIPSPYIVNFLNELGKYCQLVAVFERSESTERDKSWKKFKFINFKGVILKGIPMNVDSAASFGVVKYLKKDYYDHIIIANPCTPTGIIALEYMKLRKIPYIIESEGGFAKDGKGIKERLKKQIMSGASLYFSTSEVDDEYFLTYGAKKDRIVRFPFTTLYKEDIVTEILTSAEKDELKEKLNFKHKKMILSVGRFIPSKGYNTLIRACKYISDDVGLCIIGGTPPYEIVELTNKLHLKNIYYIDYLNKNELKKYYLAADIFILPTRSDTWGLVIPEAMSFGLPVISTKQCVAALALICDSENGFVVPAKDVKALKEKMNYLLSNSEECNRMANNNIRKMQNYTIEDMVKRHMEILK